MNDTATVQSIYRYPVKGLSPEPLVRAQLAEGETLPADRLYAIENGPSGFDPAVPGYLPKTRFLMLMKNERLAHLRTRFDEASHVLRIEADGRAWRVILAPPTRMIRYGLTDAELQPGTTVTVTGHPHRSEPGEMRAEQITVNGRTQGLRR